MALKATVFLLTALACVNYIAAFSSGAPSAQCASMIPNHGNPAQTAASPYMVMVDGNDYYMPGYMRMITVKSTTGVPLRGMLCQVRRVDTNEGVGMLSLMSGESNLQLLACSGQAGTGVTHSNSAEKAMAQFYWTPTANVGDVKVMCTVVQSFTTFWTGVLSSQLMYQAPMMDGTTMMMKQSTMEPYTMKQSTMEPYTMKQSTMKPYTMNNNNNGGDATNAPVPDYNGSSSISGHTLMLTVSALIVAARRLL